MELNPLRLFQVATFYPQAINALYNRFPTLVTASFTQQLNMLFQDGFGAVHILAPYLTELGYDTFWSIANCKPLQAQWLHDNGHTLSNGDPREWLFETVRRQIETFQPDIFYTLDPITFDSKFIHSLHHRPRVVIGWRAANIPPSTDWSEFDLIISPLEKLRQAAVDLGATAADNFFPGFPKRLYENVKDVHPRFDISFCGQWTEQQHTIRNEYLSHVARLATKSNKFSCAYYLSGEIDKIPPVVQSWNQGARFGTDMYRAIRTGRIGLDARANHRLFVAGKKQDIGGNETANMRIIETVGCGVFLLAEHHENLQSMFEIGTEIETFRNKRELVDKIEYYLVHPEQRELIARRGQERCFRDHSMTKRVREFDAIVREYLRSKNEPASLSETVKMPIIKKRIEDSKSGDQTNMAEFDVKQITDLAFAEFDSHNFQNALELFEQAVSIRPDISELNYGKAIAQVRLGLVDEAIKTLQYLLSVLPDYENAKSLLAKLQSMVSPHQNVEPSSSGTHQEIRQLIEQAQTYINNGDWVEAMRAAEKAVAYGQTIPNLHYLRMLCLNAVGRHEEALEAAKAELTINPEHPAARAEFERLSESILHLQRVIEIDPERAEAWLYVALIAQQFNDSDTFRSTYSRARILDPTHPKVLELSSIIL